MERAKPSRKGSANDFDLARKWMHQDFFDVRSSGAVMSAGTNADQARGPVQLTSARSLEPIVALEHSITRLAVATEAEGEKQQGDNRTMGRKHTAPCGLYRTQRRCRDLFDRRTVGRASGSAAAGRTHDFDADSVAFDSRPLTLGDRVAAGPHSTLIRRA